MILQGSSIDIEECKCFGISCEEVYKNQNVSFSSRRCWQMQDICWKSLPSPCWLRALQIFYWMPSWGHRCLGLLTWWTWDNKINNIIKHILPVNLACPLKGLLDTWVSTHIACMEDGMSSCWTVCGPHLGRLLALSQILWMLDKTLSPSPPFIFTFLPNVVANIILLVFSLPYFLHHQFHIFCLTKMYVCMVFEIYKQLKGDKQ